MTFNIFNTIVGYGSLALLIISSIAVYNKAVNKRAAVYGIVILIAFYAIIIALFALRVG